MATGYDGMREEQPGSAGDCALAFHFLYVSSFNLCTCHLPLVFSQSYYCNPRLTEVGRWVDRESRRRNCRKIKRLFQSSGGFPLRHFVFLTVPGCSDSVRNNKWLELYPFQSVPRLNLAIYPVFGVDSGVEKGEGEMALTALAVKNLKPSGLMYRRSDSGGLCIEVTPSGRKLWRWRYHFAGKAQTLALGRFPEVTLEQARRKRDDARQQVLNGKHPGRERRAAKMRLAASNGNTFEAVAKAWHQVKKPGLNEKYHAQILARMRQHVFPAIGALPISEIGIPDVARVVEKIGSRGTIETAHRMKQVMAQVFRYAAHRGLCQFNPAADMRDLLPQVEERHHACIAPQEFPDLLKAIDAYGGRRLTKAALNLVALTFVRTGELIAAKWSEIDLAKAEWNIPAERMKMRRPHFVPLSMQSLEILKELHAITGTKEHVFHSQCGKQRHISNGAMLVALRRLHYGGRMTGHGFRALASTILNEKGYSPDVIERQLAHEDEDKIRSAYNRAEYRAERVTMMQEWADYLDRLRSSSGTTLMAA
jgi:integrase